MKFPKIKIVCFELMTHSYIDTFTSRSLNYVAIYCSNSADFVTIKEIVNSLMIDELLSI